MNMMIMMNYLSLDAALPNTGRSPSCRLWTADANSHIPSSSHAVTCHYPAILRQCRTRAGRPHAILDGRFTHTMPFPYHEPAVAFRGRIHNGIFVAWQGNGTACVNQTRPHYVNQIGKAQSKRLAERHGRRTAWYV
jgi:hypothetical protein